MATTHSLEDLKNYHGEAIKFFGSELMLLKDVIPLVNGDRMKESATLLISCGQTGAALFQLATQVDTFIAPATMLARSFLETIVNFCYANVCDDTEYRRFLLHPIYKLYFTTDRPQLGNSVETLEKNAAVIYEKRAKLKTNTVVQEALSLFSESKPNLKWTNKSLDDRIEAIKQYADCYIDIFLTLSKFQYYSDASEILHGSLYGSTYHVGAFDPYFERDNMEELDKKLYADCTLMLLHLGMLIHGTLTFISKRCDIEGLYRYSYDNWKLALSLMSHIGKE